MVSFPTVNTPTIPLSPNREQTTARDNAATRERLQTTKPSGSDVAKTEANDQKNLRSTQVLADARNAATSNGPQGNRRGSLLDLSV